MGTNYNVDPISGIPTATDINDNLEQIEEGLDRSLSRYGDSPNSMQDDIDMNNNRIYNLPKPVDDTEPVRKVDALSAVDDAIEAALEAEHWAHYTNGVPVPEGSGAFSSKSYASDAEDSANAAAASAADAGASEINAAASEAAAQATYDNFDDRYLGDKSNDPSTDNDGNALLTGALYFNTTAGNMRVYDGAAWLVITFQPDVVAQVDSRTEMKAYDVPAGYQFSLAEGGRSGIFVVKTGTPPSDPQEGIYVVLNNGNYAERIFSEALQVKWFGAVGDGVHDDTSAIQSAIDFAQSSSTKKITANDRLSFAITNPITINSDNIWVDLSDSELKLDDSSGILSHIVIGDGVVRKNAIIIDNITFTRQQSATSGCAIETNLVGVLKIRDNRIFGDSKIYNGLYLKRSIISEISGNYIDNVINKGIELGGTGVGSDRTVDTYICENRVEGCKTALSTWDFVEGVFCRDNIFFNTSQTVVTASASSVSNGLVSFKFQENDFDTSGVAGIFVDNVSNVQINGNWFSNITTKAVRIGQGVDAVIINSNQIYPGSDGIEIAGNSSLIDGNLISGGTSCIFVKSTATNNLVSNNVLSNCDIAVNLSENPADADIFGNRIFNVASISISDAVSPNARNIRSNTGDSAIGSVGFASVGASPYTYTTGSRPETVSIYGGTVSDISIDGASVAFSTNRTFTLPPQTGVVITYSSTPFVSKFAI